MGCRLHFYDVIQRWDTYSYMYMSPGWHSWLAVSLCSAKALPPSIGWTSLSVKLSCEPAGCNQALIIGMEHDHGLSDSFLWTLRAETGLIKSIHHLVLMECLRACHTDWHSSGHLNGQYISITKSDPLLSPVFHSLKDEGRGGCLGQITLEACLERVCV